MDRRQKLFEWKSDGHKHFANVYRALKSKPDARACWAERYEIVKVQKHFRLSFKHLQIPESRFCGK